MKPIDRRTVLGLSSLALAGCSVNDPYFGTRTPPSTQTLIYEIGAEPSGLDPATSLGASEAYIWPALLETLISWDPASLAPRAGLATHYQVDASLTGFVFFLRGHRSPRGTKLPGTGSAPAGAMWSDGRPVTAHDFVFAWRRLVDPALGAANANYLYALTNGKAITEGKARLESLGIRALDDHTLQVSLEMPAAHFLKIAAIQALAAVPQHAIQQHGSSWTTPGRMVSCGPFLLHEWRPYDRIVVQKNEHYYDATRVPLRSIVFLPVTDGAAGVNLYKAGSAYAMHGRAVPPLWIPALRGRRDFHTAPTYRDMFYAFNTTRPPFDNVLLRYAFNMAVEKGRITRFLDGGQMVARTLVPPYAGYEGIRTLPVEAAGRVWDVLSYDPEAARELMRLSGAGPLTLDLTFPNRVRSKEIAEILQRQWSANLGARVNLVTMDWNIWVQTLQAGTYRGMIECGFGADYADPASFFEGFDGRTDGSGWTDPGFRRMVNEANAEGDTASRMRKLVACEEHFLRSMPLLPLFFDTNSYLQKPFVGGMTPNILDIPDFKGVWIDTHWRQPA